MPRTVNTTGRPVDRRAFVLSLGALGGAVLLPGVAAGNARFVHDIELSGLGLTGRVSLVGVDRYRAAAIATACRERLGRLDQALSLYRADSAIRRLNRAGRLDHAPADLGLALERALDVAAGTGGAFDPSVQALWTLYSRAFSERGPGQAPSQLALARTLGRIGYRHIHHEPGTRRVRFERPGMTVTLNGIAQGYAADALADTIRDAGCGNFLVDFGEFRAYGTYADDRPWRVGVAAPVRGRLTMVRVLELSDRALATSAGYGLRFDPRGRYHHLFNPATGTSPAYHASVSVTAPTAAAADAYATAFATLPLSDIRRSVGGQSGMSAVVVSPDGDVQEL